MNIRRFFNKVTVRFMLLFDKNTQERVRAILKNNKDSIERFNKKPLNQIMVQTIDDVTVVIDEAATGYVYLQSGGAALGCIVDTGLIIGSPKFFRVFTDEKALRFFVRHECTHIFVQKDRVLSGKGVNKKLKFITSIENEIEADMVSVAYNSIDTSTAAGYIEKLVDVMRDEGYTDWDLWDARERARILRECKLSVEELREKYSDQIKMIPHHHNIFDQFNVPA